MSIVEFIYVADLQQQSHSKAVLRIHDDDTVLTLMPYKFVTKKLFRR